jgi:hypothetical protein
MIGNFDFNINALSMVEHFALKPDLFAEIFLSICAKNYFCLQGCNNIFCLFHL